MKLFKNCLVASIATAGMSSMALAQLLSVNFAIDGAGAGFAGDGPLAPGDIAGLIPAGNWNNTAGVSGFQGGLLDSSGGVTGVSVSWSAASGLWSTNAENDTNQFGGGVGPDHMMMSGYLDYFVGNPALISFGGLNPLLPVDVILYTLTAVTNRTAGEWSVNGGLPQQAISQISGIFDPGGPDLTPGVAGGGEDGNFLLFPGVLPDAGGNVTLNTTGLEFRAAVNGIQLQIVPEPSAIALALLGTFGFMGIRRRR